jgi:hypothetical protein
MRNICPSGLDLHQNFYCSVDDNSATHSARDRRCAAGVYTTAKLVARVETGACGSLRQCPETTAAGFKPTAVIKMTLSCVAKHQADAGLLRGRRGYFFDIFVFFGFLAIANFLSTED